MKAKDFLKKITEQGKINNEDFNKVLETFPDVELGEVFPNLFQENFLTMERAIADERVNKKIRAEVLNAVDENIKKVLPFIDAKDREEIEKEVSSYKKIALLEKAIPNLVNKAKTDNPNTAEELKLANKKLQDLADSITVMKSEHAEELKKAQTVHEAEKVTMKVDWDLHERITGLTLADEFTDPERKKATINVIKQLVKAGNDFNYDDQGQLRVYENKNGVPTLKFNGNDQVTIDSLVTSAASPFIKRNNAGDDKKDKPKDDKPRRRETQDDIDPNKMTLADRRRAAFAQ